MILSLQASQVADVANPGPNADADELDVVPDVAPTPTSLSNYINETIWADEDRMSETI